MVAPALDGMIAAESTGSAISSAVVTTTLANDIVCVLSYCEQAGGGGAITGISGGGLTWTLRTRSHGSARGSMELWWALAPSPLSATTITVSFAATFDGQSMLVFAVSGCDTSNPWDGNGSLPASISANSNIAPSYTVNTNNANDFLITAAGCASNPDLTGTIPSGFTLLGTHINAHPGLWATIGAAYEQVTVPQVSASVTWGTIVGSNFNATESILDALTADSGSTDDACVITGSFALETNASIVFSTAAIITGSFALETAAFITTTVNVGQTVLETIACNPNPSVHVDQVFGEVVCLNHVPVAHIIHMA